MEGAKSKAGLATHMVQLINGVNLCGKMRKSLGSKRNEMGVDDIATITRSFGDFEAVDATAFDEMGLDKPDGTIPSIAEPSVSKWVPSTSG